MKAHFFTLVLDGEPFIRHHYQEFCKTDLDWHWYVVEGQSGNNQDTSWCQRLKPRISTDGTHEYVLSLRDPRVTFISKPWWDSKTDMCNSAVSNMRDPGFIMQVDSDEIWTFDQLNLVGTIFNKNPDLNVLSFSCRFYVGPDVVVSRENSPGQWTRAWRFERPWRFDRHEPPIFNGNRGGTANKEVTGRYGLTFDHFSYATESQVAYKEKFYGYWGAVDGWKRLQANTEWPARLKDYLSWSDESVYVERISHKWKALVGSPILPRRHAGDDGSPKADPGHREPAQPIRGHPSVLPSGLPVRGMVRSRQPEG